MRYLSAFTGLLTAMGLLLPLCTPADSGVRSATHDSSTAAHVDFMIVIPAALSLDLAALPRAASVAIYSSGRNVTLAATPARPQTRSIAMPTSKAMILTAAARRAIAQNVACATEEASSPIICTVSMP